MTDDDQVAWGISWDSVQRIANVTARRSWDTILNFDERCDAAEDGIIDALFDATTAPTTKQLMDAGRAEIQRVSRAVRHLRGAATRDLTLSWNYARFWNGVPSARDALEERIIERIAVYQILPKLPEIEYQAIQALADMGTYDAAAAWLGWPPALFKARLKRGRVTFRAWWHEGETPSRQWARDNRGTTRTSVTYRIRANRRWRARKDTAA